MKKRPLPKPGNIYTLNWKDFGNNDEVIFQGKRDFTFIKIVDKNHFLIKDASGKTHRLPDYVFFKKLVASKAKQEQPEDANICRFIDVTFLGRFRKDYSGLQIKNKFYYVKNDVVSSINVNRDNVRLDEEYAGVPANADPALKEMYFEFIRQHHLEQN